MALDLIRRWCHPLEGAMEVEDGGVELTLGLSVGGSSRKVTTDAAPPKRVAETKSREVELEIGVPISPPPPSHRQPPPFLHFDKEVVSTLDQARRRDIHAFRRREARRKRNKRKHQQQKRRGICHSRSDAASAGTAARFFSASLETPCSPDDRLVMEAREQNLKAKDREAQVETLGFFHNRKLSANRSPIPNTDADSHTILNPNPVPFSEQSFSMLAMPNSFPHLPYFSNTEDLGMPCLLPCRAATMAPAAERQRSDGNIFHPVACRVFQSCLPPLVEASNRGSPPSSNAVESNSGKDAVERTTSWTASQGSSGYPAASAHYTASPTGIRNDVGSGGTSDGSSHPCPSSAKRHLHPETPILHRADCLPRGLSENCSSSCPFDPDLPSGLASQSPPRAEILPPNKRIVQAAYNSCSPPRQMDPLSSLPRMPCVSTTGNGPNGKTITGVLYRYTKAEVSIVCACHGNFFSPAEFVQHAGGTDVIHPLRQITVVSY